VRFVRAQLAAAAFAALGVTAPRVLASPVRSPGAVSPGVGVHGAGLLDPGRWNFANWSEVSDSLTGVKTGLRTSLRFPFIVPGSDTVRVDGVKLGRDGYVINYTLGTIRIDVPLTARAPVVVVYRREPLLLQPVYRLRAVEIARPGREPAPVRARRSATKKIPESIRNLTFGGSKSVSFQVGTNRGTQLDQTLQATIEGQITPTIRVRALLSDNNLPIQPEGNTEELQYFDQVFVEIEGSRARASLGDFSFENHESSFSPITRRLKGFSGSIWRSGGERIKVAGATAKGEYRRSQFRGHTGLQGPYDLLSAARVTTDVIIAGSEVVVVDGAAMRRGKEADYVIDYDAGTITFTPRRLITDDTEVAVDYEVTQARYRRSTIFASGENIPLVGGAHLGVLFAREGDDVARPVNAPLSKDDRHVLDAAGDDANAAITGGATQVAAGSGEYVLVTADTVTGVPAHFVFSDSMGNYSVSFVEVTPGTGGYRFAGISARGTRYYEFTPDSSGTYVVGRRVFLPERVTLFNARVQRAGRHFSLDTEWNASVYDRNLLSARDDRDNTGTAYRARAGLNDLPAGVGTLEIGAQVSGLESRFRSFDRARPQYFYRDWNLENAPLRGTETIASMDAKLVRGEKKSLGYVYSHIRRDDFSGTRNEGRITAGDATRRGLTARGFYTDVSGLSGRRTRSHADASSGFALWRFVPSLGVAGERYLQRAVSAPDSGLAYRLVRAGLADRAWRRGYFRVEYEQRQTDVVDTLETGWHAARTDRTASATVGTRATRSLRGEVTVTHRQEDDVRAGRTTTDLARVKATINASNLGIRSDVDYEINQAAVRTLNRSIVRVGEGRGDFNMQGDFVGKGKGSYAVVFAPTDDVQPANRVAFNFHFAWKPADGRVGRGHGGLRAWLRRNVSFDQTLGVDEQTRFSPAWKVYLLVPSALQRNSETLFGVVRLHQEWSFLDGVNGTSLTARLRREDTEDNRFEGVKENRLTEDAALRFSRSVSGTVSINVEAGRRIDRRTGSGLATTTGSTYDIVDRSAVLGVGLRFFAGGSLDVDSRTTRRRDTRSGTGQWVLGFRPRLVWRVSDRINVFATYEFNRAWDTNFSGVRPAPFSLPGASHRWNVAPNLRLARIISVVATYSGRSEKAFSGTHITEHEFRLETRALF